MIHPTLQQVRFEGAQQASQFEGRSKAGESRLHATTENRYIELCDANSQRPVVGERNYQWVESLPIHAAQELVQHGFGAARVESGDDVRDPHHVRNTTSGSGPVVAPARVG